MTDDQRPGEPPAAAGEHQQGWGDDQTTHIPVQPEVASGPFVADDLTQRLMSYGPAARSDETAAVANTRQARRLQQESTPPPRDRVRTLARGIGELLISAGLVVLLFVIYEVYVTDLFGHQKQERATSALEQVWARSGAPAAAGSSTAGSTSTKVVKVTNPSKLVVDPASRKRNYQTLDGQGFAKIYIPSFGADFSFTIIEGTNDEDLYTGPGHYQKTQYPGEQGNFSVAGHRVSKGSPFNNLGLLNSCDAIVIETQNDWFVYRVLPLEGEVATWTATQHAHCAGIVPGIGQYAGVFGREITVPSDYAQVLPVPHVDSIVVPPNAERLVTLTTCHPQFSDTQRMIIHGLLVKSYAKATGFLPPELSES